MLIKFKECHILTSLRGEGAKGDCPLFSSEGASHSPHTNFDDALTGTVLFSTGELKRTKCVYCSIFGCFVGYHFVKSPRKTV